MDREKSAEVVRLFDAMTKVNNARPKAARKAKPAPARLGTTIIRSTIVVVGDVGAAEAVAKLLQTNRP
jgi:hypothetical protein